MDNIEEKLGQIQAEIRKTPYHKGTEHHIGLLKAKLAKLRDLLIEKSSKKGGGTGFAIPKVGDATCVLVGLPSVGKSTILSKLSNAKPKIASYPFTTLTVIPGIMNYKGAAIQILDVPGIVGGAARGVGSGKEVLSIVRVANLLILICEAAKFSEQKKQILTELETSNVRVNKLPPDIKIRKLSSGGLKVISIPNCGVENSQIVKIAQGLGLTNAEIQIKEKITQDDLIDTILANRVYLPAIFVGSKTDLTNFAPQDGVILISALKNLGLEELNEKIWQNLDLIRVYLKPAGGAADFKKPLILKYRSKLVEAAGKISQELADELKGGQIIRNNLKKQVGINFELENKDIITFLT